MSYYYDVAIGVSLTSFRELWEYEKELRIWSNNEYESLKEEFLKSWKIIPSPLISVEECKKLLKTDPRYEAVCSLMNIEENKYFGTYKTR